MIGFMFDGIAAGSGCSVSEIDGAVTAFNQSK